MKTYLYIAAMALTTYLIRVLPLTLIRKPIRNEFLRSFLYYIPYAVLSVMTIPAIFYATSSTLSAVAGFVMAMILAWLEKSLLTVAASACGAVFLVELIMRLCGAG